MLDWFKSVMRGENPPAPSATPAADGATPAAPAQPEGAEVAGLNFKTAIDAHMKWKIRLESYISGTSNEDLKVDVVCRDDQCPLGKWIYDKGGEKFGYSETFYEMKTHHAHFHRCAGIVLSAAQAGDTGTAIKLLNGGEYVKASERVKTLLARMFVIASEGREALDSHIRWKSRLKHYIAGDSQEDLRPDVVASDGHCTLGKWLNGIGGERFGMTSEYAVLKARHAHFHRCAGEVLEVAARGDTRMALHMLEAGAYPDASEQVAAAIVALFEQQTAKA
jgi:hypothetical protein